jgi:putative peptidoglycan lipid II flippase
MAAGTLLSRITGLLRLTAFGLLGVSILTDTYLFANNSPNLIYELVVGGVLSSTLVPLFIDLFHRAETATGNPDATAREIASSAVSAVTTLALAAVCALSIALFALAPAVIRVLISGKATTEQRDLAVDLLRMFAPQVALYGMITVATALLNARRRFAAPMFAPIVNNIVMIFVFLWAGHRIDSLQRQASELAGLSGTALDQARFTLVAESSSLKQLLGFGTTVGVLIHCVVLIVTLRREAIGLRWNWDPGHPAIKRLLRLSGWTIGYVIANQIALIFIIRVASRNASDFSAYNLANSTFFLLPHGVIAVSIITATQTELAQAFVQRRRGDFRRLTETGVRSLLALIIPSAMVLFVLAQPLVSLALEHGKTDADDARRIAQVLRAFALGLPGFSIYLFLMSALKALRDTKATFEVNCVENALNIVLAAAFTAFLGVRGLALGFALAYLISAVVALGAVGRRMGGISGARLIDVAGRITAAATVMGLVMWAVARVFGGIVEEGQPGFGRVITQGIQVGVSVMAGVTVFALVGRLLGVRELTVALSGIRRRFVR